MPIYVLRANTVAQMEACLSDIFDLEHRPSAALDKALQEADEAVRQVTGGEAEVELAPQSAYIRRRQHELAHAVDLNSYSVGKEPHRSVRICRGE